MFMKGLLICGVSVCVCGFQLSSSLCEQREAPEQGGAQVEVMEGTGSDKMYREERGREGEAECDWPRQIPSHANHNNERREVNNDSRKAEHKLEGWISSHKADWELLKRSTTGILV